MISTIVFLDWQKSFLTRALNSSGAMCSSCVPITMLIFGKASCNAFEYCTLNGQSALTQKEKWTASTRKSVRALMRWRSLSGPIMVGQPGQLMMPTRSSFCSAGYSAKAPFRFLKSARQLADEHPRSCVAFEQVRIPIRATAHLRKHLRTSLHVSRKRTQRTQRKSQNLRFPVFNSFFVFLAFLRGKLVF